MSRIGRMPITVPAGVQVDIKGYQVKVKGPKGELQREFSPLIGIAFDGPEIAVTRRSDAPAERALHGTTRAVLHNMIHGVSAGFVTILEWDGVGYRAEMSGTTLVLHMGFSHPIKVEPVEGISFDVDVKLRQIKVMGYDKEMVGQVAANIRKVRPVEPYLGKGLHYLGEKIRRKAGKSGKGKK
ncbi:MAG TPA: 50S ribosomal protein L6 [Anaerolineae bacterium]|nr:50S ribosomal protein L6 [Anaerolineae bacterium]HAE59000.1 50S ribosomal protein L6 [Anaerolineae bacterium]